MTTPTLLPCPFCGGPVTLERTTDTYERLHGRRGWWGVKCRNRLNLGGTCAIEQVPSASQSAAVERWNRRAAPEAAEPQTGSWIAAEDVRRSARAIDVALNGEDGAAKAPALIDVEAQIVGLARALGRPIAAPTDSQAGRDAVEAAAQISAQGCPVAWFSRAVHDVTVERLRQVDAEGWTPEHDDEHREGEMAFAAAGYAVAASDHTQAVVHEFDAHGEPTLADDVDRPSHAPWPHGWDFKPAPARRLLVKAGALILAEIERLDRLSTTTGRG